MDMNHRLNQYDRGSIVKTFLEYTFKEQDEIIHEREADLAKRAREHVLAKTIVFAGRTYKESDFLDLLPENYTRSYNRIWVNAGGYNVELQFSGDYSLPSVEKKMPFDDQWGNRRNITDAKLNTEIQELVQLKEKTNEKRNNLRRKMNAFLKDIRTVKKMLEVMPELKDILGEKWFTAPAPTTAIVVTAKEILCEMANLRGEPREGCCNGEVIAL